MKRLLIIEDNTELCDEVSEILSFEGYIVDCAKDGYEGLRKARIALPDLILCDIMLPDIDGYEVYQQIHQLISDNITPFIFITALSDRDNFRYGMELGADDYLTKPFTRDELLKTIGARLKRSNKTEGIIKQRVKALEKNLAERLQKTKNPGYSSFFSDADENMDSVNVRMKYEAFRVIETNQIVDNIKQNIYNELQSKCSPEQKKFLLNLEKRIDTPNVLWDNLSLFLMQFDEKYPSFFSKVEKKHPGLTRYERVLFAVIFLELETHQVASLLSVSPDSVRKSRYRLKKKLGLKTDDNLYDYIQLFDKE